MLDTTGHISVVILCCLEIVGGDILYTQLVGDLSRLRLSIKCLIPDKYKSILLLFRWKTLNSPIIDCINQYHGSVGWDYPFSSEYVEPTQAICHSSASFSLWNKILRNNFLSLHTIKTIFHRPWTCQRVLRKLH